ncbi:MAG: ATP phosphoribosyltransferase regulatory subunit [Asgard group archaeon]|nr:ATP phosphoribosyltransferase regulatory subunit [Asgard group archaeon]
MEQLKEKIEQWNMFLRNLTPNGTKDFLPEEVQQFAVVKSTLHKTIQNWGYQEVHTPIIEFVENMAMNLGPEIVKKMFKFQDFNGEIVAMRPEMTIPIARVVASKMQDVVPPLRLYYISNVFRYSPDYDERDREFWQAGVELIGYPSIEADGEILALLSFTLRMIGLKDYRIKIGKVNLIEEILDLTNLSKFQKTVLQSIVSNRDKKAFEKMTKRGKIQSEIRDFLLKLLSLENFEDILKIGLRNIPLIDDFLTEMYTLYDILSDYNCLDNVVFDPTINRKIDYYTGIIFEVSLPSSKLTLGGGGRFDNLVEKFGSNKLSGIGFALEVDKLVEALRMQNRDFLTRRKRMRILVSSKKRNAGIKMAKVLRKFGCEVALDVNDIDLDSLDIYAKKQDYEFVVFLDRYNQGKITVYEVQSDASETISIAAIEKLLIKD